MGPVIEMNVPENIIITDILPPITVHLEKGRRVKMTNRHSFGLSLCISGQITYTMNGKNYVSHPGNAVILPQGGTYTLSCDKEGFFPVMDFKSENCNCKEITVLPLKNPQGCVQDFKLLQDLFLRNESRLKKLSTFYGLLSKVFVSDSQKHPFLDAVIRFVEENIQNPALTNTVLAKRIGISEVYLRKLFAAHYGMTPKQYILDIRIRKAKQMLTDTPFTVTAIAEECGFSSLYHFCRIFRQRTGLTPSQFAVRNRSYKI